MASLARGELILTLVPPPLIQDNDAQAKARRDLAVALHNYKAIFFDARRTFADWDSLTTFDRQQAIHWAYEAEYAAFLRPRVQQDVHGNQVNGE